MNRSPANPVAPANAMPPGRRAHLLEAIWDHSLDAILLTAPDGRIFAANPAACRMFGRTEAEICRAGRNGLLDPADPRLAAALVERAQTGRVQQELTLVHADGRRFPGEVTSAVFTDSDGQAKTSMLIRDISGRRQAEAQLRELALLPLRNPGPVLRVSPAGVVRMANPAAAALGLVDGASLGAVIPMLQHLDLPAHIRAGTRFECEVRACEKTFLFTVQGEPDHNVALLYGANITERKRAEAAVRESEQRFAKVFRASPAAIGISRLDTGQYLDVNAAFVRLYGYAREEIIGHTAVELRLWHSPDREQVLRELREKKSLSLIEVQGRRKHGELRDLLAAVELIDLGGVTCLLGILTDITERKRAEAELAASQLQLRALAARLQAAREEERQRIAHLIHDDLGHALTDLRLDLAWLDRRLAERRLTRRSALRRKLAAMGRQVEDNLNAARTLSTELHPAILDTLGFAAALEWALQRFAERTHIACTLAPPPEPLALAADRSAALFRVLQELLSNVARHAHATAVRLRITAAAGQVTLEVADNGRGITAQECADPQALGLLGIRERARTFGGRVEIHGTAGTGTTIRVTIPEQAA